MFIYRSFSEAGYHFCDMEAQTETIANNSRLHMKLHAVDVSEL